MKKKSVRRWKESQLRNPVVKGASSVSISELADHEVHSDVIVAGRTPRDNVFFPRWSGSTRGSLSSSTVPL